MTITATRTPATRGVWVGKRLTKACSRCGHERTLNTTRPVKSDLCRDCRYADPHVWDLTNAPPPTEDDDDDE